MADQGTINTTYIRGGVLRDQSITGKVVEEFALAKSQILNSSVGHVSLDSLVIAGSTVTSLSAENSCVKKTVIGPNTKLSGLYVANCDVSEQSAIVFSIIENSILYRLSIANGIIQDSIFDGCAFIDTVFTKINFKSTSFKGCTFSGCGFIDCDFDSGSSNPVFYMCNFEPFHVLGLFQQYSQSWPNLANYQLEKNRFVRCAFGEPKVKFAACCGGKNTTHIEPRNYPIQIASGGLVHVPRTTMLQSELSTLNTQPRVTIPIKGKYRPFRFTTEGI